MEPYAYLKDVLQRLPRPAQPRTRTSDRDGDHRRCRRP
ncbi:MAG: hypothetical protein ACRD3R_08420 [Terriglobales bacterium]